MFTNGIYWRNIIAGIVTTFAVSIVMAMLGMALGFTVIDPMSSDPFSGLGMAFGVWSIVSVVVSLAAGAFVAGFFAGVRGGEHGFMVWAGALLLGTFLGGQALGAAVGTVGSAAREVGSGMASVASSAAGGVADLAAGVSDDIRENVHLELAAGPVTDEVAAVLRDTGLPTLQPEYLRDQMSEARLDLRHTANQLLFNSENHDQVIGDFLERQKTRLADITGEVDRDTAAVNLMRVRDISRDEAYQEVDNAVAIYGRTVAEAEEALTNAQNRLDDAREYLSVAAIRARLMADQFAAAAARSALFAALALLLGAIVSVMAGRGGQLCALRRYASNPALDISIERTTISEQPL